MRIPRVVLHMHVFNLEVLPEIAKAAFNLKLVVGGKFLRAIVTYPDGRPDIEAAARAAAPDCDCRFVAVPNRGYDIGPFVCEVVNKENLRGFDLVAKLHTKRDVDTWMNFRKFSGPEWRKELLRPFSSNPFEVKEVLKAFARWPELGYVTGRGIINYCATDGTAEVLEVKSWLERDFSLHVRHPVIAPGSIFIARSKVFLPFAGRFSWDDFVEVTGQNAHREYGLASRLERAFTMAADAMGMVVSDGTKSPRQAMLGYALQSAWFRPLRLLTKVVGR
ncbi:MAG: hypothetical protein IJG70_01910 [Kiritimatiellae bacterium]|nr:hypothetical protein [Kiritimatiellia bacterium]